MTTLHTFAFHIVQDTEVANQIVADVLDDEPLMTFESEADREMWKRVSVRNRCYDWLRLNKTVGR